MDGWTCGLQGEDRESRAHCCETLKGKAARSKSCQSLDLIPGLSQSYWWLSVNQSTSLPSDMFQTRYFPEKHRQHIVKNSGSDKQ